MTRRSLAALAAGCLALAGAGCAGGGGGGGGGEGGEASAPPPPASTAPAVADPAAAAAALGVPAEPDDRPPDAPADVAPAEPARDLFAEVVPGDGAPAAPAPTPVAEPAPAPTEEAPPVEAAPAAPAPGPAEPSAPAPAGACAGSDWPSGRTAWTVVLASARSEGELRPVRRRLDAAGTTSGVLSSSRHPGLRPGYCVVFSGSFATRAQAARHASGLQRLRPDAYPRLVAAAP